MESSALFHLRWLTTVSQTPKLMSSSRLKTAMDAVCEQENTHIVRSFVEDEAYATGLIGAPVAIVPGPVLHGTEITLSAPRFHRLALYSA
jgi:hypothetical protein